jgi:hypothetical protein
MIRAAILASSNLNRRPDMKNILATAIVAAGLVGLSAAVQAAPVSGMQTAASAIEGSIVHVRMSPRERMMRERMMRQRMMHRRMRHR